MFPRGKEGLKIITKLGGFDVSCIFMKHYFKKEMYIAIRSLVSKYNIITIIIRCLVGSTDQACSSGFYFGIA